MTTRQSSESTEIDGLRQRINELERQLRAAAVNDRERARELRALEEQAQLLDLAHDAIMVRRLDGEILYWNKGAERMYGLTREQAVGRASHEILVTEFPAPLPEIERVLLENGHWEGELRHTGQRGPVVVASRWALRRDDQGNPEAVLEINNDITARKAAEAERDRRQEDLIRAQAVAIAELSTPLIPISDEVVVMPLVGVVDSSRAQQVMTTLLEGLAASRATVAILDITGVRVVDTQVADSLLRAAQGARLLGVEVVLTGIRAEVAHTLVTLGVDLKDLVTRGTLQSGIAHALRKRRAAGS